ncbi:MAG TPA: acyl-CoA dehydrogenase family protein [Acidimicrobiales bacterium]|nr:acyl-CoA dehydrogenase family protein [Acidimicrobiales bacterium]
MDGTMIDRVERILPLVQANAAGMEEARSLSPEVVAAMREAGVFRMCVPAEYGGPREADPLEEVGVFEALAAADGATGWCAMISSGTPLITAFMPEAGVKEIYADGPDVVFGGGFAPTGTAVPVDGGFQVSGKWSFASGIAHSSWLFAGCIVIEDGRPRMLPNGMPDLMHVFVPTSEAKVLDTWYVSGLCGSGSNDFTLENVLVPEHRTLRIFGREPLRSEPIHRMPLLPLFASHTAAVAMGIGRAALDEIGRLARKKTPTMSMQPLAERPTVQLGLADAEAGLRSARAFVFDALEDAWNTVSAGETVSGEQHMLLRLASAHATRASAAAVDFAYTAGGGTALYRKSPLQRYMRDVHAVTQHIIVAPQTFGAVGRVLVGLDPGTPVF